MSEGRYQVESFLPPSGWVVMTESDDYFVADDAARALLWAGARRVRVLDTTRDPETADRVVWSLTR